MLAEGLNQFLTTAVTIQAIVGTKATRKDQTTGLFPVQMPEGTPLPALVYSQISGEGNPSLDGANSLHQCRISFACYGASYGDSKRLQRAIRQLVEGLHTTLADGTPVDNALLELEMDAFEDGPFIYNAPIDFLLVYADIGS